MTDASGTPLAAQPEPLSPWLFHGRLHEPETGLFWMRARHYHPRLGRFLQPDPIGIAGGANLYAYANNNPLRWFDPWGLKMKNAEEAMESDLGSLDLSGLAEVSLFADSGFGDTIVGSTFGAPAFSNPFSQSEMDFFDANGYFNTGPTVYIRDNYSQHIPTLTSLAVGGPTVIRAGLSRAGSLGRSFMNLMTRTPARNQAARTAISSVDDVVAASSRGIDPVAATGNFVGAGNSASAAIGREIFAKTAATTGLMEGVESGFSFLNGFNGNAPNPMLPSAFDLFPNNVLIDPGNNLSNLSQSFGFGLNQIFSEPE